MARLRFRKVYFNTSTSGGGIANFSGGVVTVTSSTVSSNTFSIQGGGIDNIGGATHLDTAGRS